jgi:uncharacterized membrane protein
MIIGVLGWVLLKILFKMVNDAVRIRAVLVISFENNKKEGNKRLRKKSTACRKLAASNKCYE